MTQRIYGWKSNRILHGIASKLRSNSSKVFVEWHLGPNVSFIPDMKRYVHMMRPDVEFRSFIILRSPTSFVVSNGAYWQPRADPEDVIKKMPEALLASIVGAGEVRTYLLRSHGDAFTDAGADVAIDLPPVPAGPGTTKEPQNVTGFDQGAWLRNAREKLGCEPLVSAALHALAGLDQVLFLDDNTTIPNIHAVAQHGDASFRSRLTAEELSRTKTPHSASTSKRVKERYSTPKLIALTERENECSLLLWKRIRQSWSSSRVTGATEPSLTLRGADRVRSAAYGYAT